MLKKYPSIYRSARAKNQKRCAYEAKSTTVYANRRVNHRLSSVVSSADAKNAEEADLPKPSILILLVDDLGWGDVGYHDPQVATPNIDAIAANGVEFDRFYVNPTCSPYPRLLAYGSILHDPWRQWTHSMAFK